jgi:hypothetical protein
MSYSEEYKRQMNEEKYYKILGLVLISVIFAGCFWLLGLQSKDCNERGGVLVRSEYNQAVCIDSQIK